MEIIKKFDFFIKTLVSQVSELKITYLQSSDHCCSKNICVVLAGEVEPVHLLVVPPLVEGGRCLVVF